MAEKPQRQLRKLMKNCKDKVYKQVIINNIMPSLKIEVGKKNITLIVLLVAVLAVGVVYAFNSPSPNPSVMGHSIDEIEGMDNYYTKGEVYSKDEVNAMISAIEVGGAGGTGCPVGYTPYEQSTETAKCYKDGEVISVRYDYGKWDGDGCWSHTGWWCHHLCEARIISGNFQTRATYDPGTKREITSGWVNGVSEAYNKYYTNYKIRCTPDWSGVKMEGTKSNYARVIDLGKSSWANVLQIK